MKQTLVAILLLMVFTACHHSGSNADPSEARVNRMLDDWHRAAAEADFEGYFNHFHSDSAVFMGTDATERWTIAEFRPWSKPYFDRGRAWNFTPVERHIYFSDNGTVSWFDEKLDTPNLGPARGTGVLVKEDTTWKITHYNLSIPIPNAIADTVVKQVEEALKESSKGK